jgi:drug/metabolite transporter (DMT)-like permease
MVVIMGIVEASAVAAVNYGLTIGDAILITPIASALSIVTITLAIVFLKERVTRLQGFGMIAAVAGIVVTAFWVLTPAAAQQSVGALDCPSRTGRRSWRPETRCPLARGVALE